MKTRKGDNIERYAAGSRTSIALGVTWFRREDSPRLMQLFPDRHIMHASFDESLHDAKKMERDIQTRGQPITRIILDPGELMAWCNVRGRRPDAEARVEYVNKKTRDAAAAAKDAT